MARVAEETSERMAQRIRPEQKRIIMRAAAMSNQGLSEFVVEHSLAAARAVIEREERIQLSERDALRILELLENPPPLSERAKAAIKRLPPER
jgi:uncharacterized protein (DUF1778 family)